MVINHLLTGMILQVPVWDGGKWPARVVVVSIQRFDFEGRGAEKSPVFLGGFHVNIWVVTHVFFFNWVVQPPSNNPLPRIMIIIGRLIKMMILIFDLLVHQMVVLIVMNPMVESVKHHHLKKQTQ